MESTEQKLARVQRELEALKEEYQEFAYTLAHDLGGPLRSIEGFSSIILEKYSKIFDEKTCNHFDFIIKGAEDTKKILADLLEYSFLNLRPMDIHQPEFVNFDCNEAFSLAKDMLFSLIEQTGATLHCENLPNMTVNPLQMRLVFYHLLHNALLYQKKGVSPRIDVGCQNREDCCAFFITDNGIGIPEHLTQKVFKLLKRAVRPQDYSGSGMGLAVVKKIVQHHRGHLWLESVVDRGTTFYFTLSKELNRP